MWTTIKEQTQLLLWDARGQPINRVVFASKLRAPMKWRVKMAGSHLQRKKWVTFLPTSVEEALISASSSWVSPSLSVGPKIRANSPSCLDLRREQCQCHACEGNATLEMRCMSHSRTAHKSPLHLPPAHNISKACNLSSYVSQTELHICSALLGQNLYQKCKQVGAIIFIIRIACCTFFSSSKGFPVGQAGSPGFLIFLYWFGFLDSFFCTSSWISLDSHFLLPWGIFFLFQFWACQISLKMDCETFRPFNVTRRHCNCRSNLEELTI